MSHFIFYCFADESDCDRQNGYHKYGLNTGATAIIPFYKKFSFSLETIYNQKGSYQRAWLPDDSLNGQYKLVLNYVDVPVFFKFEDKDIIKFGAGFSWGRLVEFKEWEHKQRVNWDTPISPYKKSDVDLLIDVQFRLIQGLSLDMRYSIFTKVRLCCFISFLRKEIIKR